MLPQRAHFLIKAFSTSINWRTQVKREQLVFQISSILLQRRNWVPLLRGLNLSSNNLTSSLFLQILRKTQSNPQISFNFFNWAKSSLGFEPDLKSQCHMIYMLLGSGLSHSAKPVLESLARSYPASEIVDSLIQACTGEDSLSPVLSTVLEVYSKAGGLREAIEVFNKMRALGFAPSINACNALLDRLQRAGDIELAWCLYGAIIRTEVLPDRSTWSLVARILYKSGSFGGITRMLEVGIRSSAIYNLLVDSCSKKGDFEGAFYWLSEMSDKNLAPSFSSYSSVLDGACRCANSKAVERIMGMMVDKGLLPELPFSETNLVIEKLCHLGKTYAAEMFYKRACDNRQKLHDATYGSMLRALSKEGRVEEAMEMHCVISEKEIQVNNRGYHEFVNALCSEDPRKEVSELLMELINRGFCPNTSELSRYMASLCNRRRWQEAEHLLEEILETGSLPDAICCRSLMKHYCTTRRIESAIALYKKMEKLNFSLDTTSYDVLLSELFVARKIDEAIRIFDYMRTQNVMSSSSFVIMIKGLCNVKELRKAMKIHDEMLKMGLKPDKKTYKRLISGFA